MSMKIDWINTELISIDYELSTEDRFVIIHDIQVKFKHYEKEYYLNFDLGVLAINENLYFNSKEMDKITFNIGLNYNF